MYSTGTVASIDAFIAIQSNAVVFVTCAECVSEYVICQKPQIYDGVDEKTSSNSSSSSDKKDSSSSATSKDPYVEKVKLDIDDDPRGRRESLQDEDNDSRNSTNTDISTTSVGDIVDTSPRVDRMVARPLIPSSDEASLP
ncbi:hypothetical protein CEXT_696871 [Caerostris extrusa]|uniref:Uncharacterized protein n=1 Tax=Caerostris extrusa TaxID=172846 RepID=A0AAV4SZD6_CAEEX|nr:hypothetical protein CEXT_696871 [Caerostris extrusa]